MCGITRRVDFGRDLRGQRAAIEAMTATMICRGPDAGGVWCSAHAAIGHQRLSVIDLPGGEQPMRAPGEDDVVLTFSGEIYNFTELRCELAARGHHFRTRSDTEVLLHAYLEWGADCVRGLNGMFAFGVWDGRRQELLLARDRLGVKPLYYAPQADGVLFGSEPKAILAHPQFRAEIDSEGLAELFSQIGTATPGHGVYRGLCQVRPGTQVRVGRGGVRTCAYWALEAREHTDDLAATAGTVRDLLTDAVDRRRWPMCSLRRRDHAKLATFSVDFTGSADAFTPDQLRPSHGEPFARAAAGHIGSRHGTITLEAEDLVTAQWAPQQDPPAGRFRVPAPGPGGQRRAALRFAGPGAADGSAQDRAPGCRQAPDAARAGLCDKAYSSSAIRGHLRCRGIRATIPEPADQVRHRLRCGIRGSRPPAFGAAACKQRDVVERAFCHLRQHRAVATRYIKRD